MSDYQLSGHCLCGAVVQSEEIFVDEQPDYCSFSQKTTRKTGPEVIADAKAAGFEF